MTSRSEVNRTPGRATPDTGASLHDVAPVARELPPLARDQLRRLSDLLATDPEAPTSIRARRAIEDDHLADSLVAVGLPVIQAADSIVDIGSGAGVPGLPLAIAIPSSQVWLLESNRRKCLFLDRAILACGLDNATVVGERAELWEAGRGRFDVVTARAVASLAVVAEYAAPLLRIGGTLVAWRGRRDPHEEAEASQAAEILGLRVDEPPVPVHPYPGAEHRHLHLMLKVTETPSGFPRRPGIAVKRPLGRRRSEDPR